MLRPPSVGGRSPLPGWPLWIVFGMLLVLTPVTMTRLDAAAETSRELATRERDSAGRSAVIVGSLVDTDTTSGLPKETPVYLLRLPARAELPARTIRATGPSTWGFPPSDEHPPRREFLVIVDEPPRVIANGAVGTLRAPTAASAARAAASARGVSGAARASRVVLPIALTGTAATAILFDVRRARAGRAQRRAPFADDPTWWAPPRT